MTRPLETGIPFDDHRTTPVSMMGPFADLLQQNNVDYMWIWDELSTWFPGNLWTPENTPAAAVIDSNALYDPFVEAAFAVAHNHEIGLRLSTDAVRTAPAELLRKVLSLQNATSGKVVMTIGAGELRQSKPFGYKRSEGLKRLEDNLVLVNKLYDAKEPVSHEGNFWNYQNAFLGHHRPAVRPEFWALGGGPILLDIAAKHADGFEAAVPQAIVGADAYAKTVTMMREKVESHGRDPDKFGFGVWLIGVLHDDPDMIQVVLDNPIVKYFAGQFGRLDQKNWIEEGIVPVMPEDWHYAMKWEPFVQSDEEVNRIVGGVSKEMARKAYHVGTPDQMTKIAQGYVDAGANFIGIIDMTPLALGPADAMDSVRRSSQVYSALKKAQAGR